MFAPLAVKVTLVVMQLSCVELGVIFICGTPAAALTLAEPVEVQPLALVTVTRYKPAVLALMVEVVWPLLQR